MLVRQLRQGVALELLRCVAAGVDARVFEGDAQQKPIEGRAVFEVLLFLAHLHFVQRRLCNVDVATLDQLGHLAVEKGKQQGADVCAVDVGIGHDDDAVVAQFVDVEIVRARLARLGAHLANAGAECCDERQNFIAG